MTKLELIELRLQTAKTGIQPIRLLFKDYYVFVSHPNMLCPELSLRDKIALIWLKIKYFRKPIMGMFREQNSKVRLI